jgi:hypothetical protein
MDTLQNSGISPSTECDVPESPLMKTIATKFGVTIAGTVTATRIPESFLAALIANESGGNPSAKRFEISHFGEILAVVAGVRATFNPPGISRALGAKDFASFLNPDPVNSGINLPFSIAIGRAVSLATSIGLTQIMGWHYLEFDLAYLLPVPDIEKQLRMTMNLLAYFANRYTLNFSSDAEKLFACWNCGFPDPSKTYDPHYCANGLRRMAIYEVLHLQTAAAPAAEAGSGG